MEHNGNEFPVLIGQAGPLNGQRWMITQTLVVGRDPSCEIIIPDRQVSRYHARLMPAPDGIILEDLGSKNGTHCNGLRLDEPVVLRDGDAIQVAVVQSFVYLSSDATMPLEASDRQFPEPAHRLRLESRSRRVWIGNQEVTPSLSVPQFRLLQVLYDQPDRVVSREHLIDAIWSDQNAQGVSEQALDALVRRLRDRLSTLDPTHEYIITIRGHGLRLENPLA
ncbi:MAG: FHA domain-containing protein [Anaerolineaceae bacterium]|nr:FHA domain-containing protein [Anaerolineaceae bacterium]